MSADARPSLEALILRHPELWGHVYVERALKRSTYTDEQYREILALTEARLPDLVLLRLWRIYQPAVDEPPESSLCLRGPMAAFRGLDLIDERWWPLGRRRTACTTDPLPGMRSLDVHVGDGMVRMWAVLTDDLAASNRSRSTGPPRCGSCGTAAHAPCGNARD